MMSGTFLRVFVILLGGYILFITILSLARRKMEDQFCLLWSVMSILMILAGILLRPSQISKYMSISALVIILIALLGTLWGLWFISTQVSVLLRKNQELAMQVTLLNQDCEQMLKDIETLKKKLEDTEDNA